MNKRAGDALQKVTAALQGRDIPRVGWPTTVLPPRDVRVSAREGANAITIFVEDGEANATARLDLQSREVVIASSGPDAPSRSQLRRVALEYVADRNAFDRLSDSDCSSIMPEFDPLAPATWTEMQLLAGVTDSDWYPPEPADRSPDGWANFYATAHRFNDRFTSPDAAATTPRPTPPRGGQ